MPFQAVDENIDEEEDDADDREAEPTEGGERPEAGGEEQTENRNEGGNETEGENTENTEDTEDRTEDDTAETDATENNTTENNTEGGETVVEDSRFSWVIGADGGRSQVRKGLGLKFLGETDDQGEVILGDIQVNGGLREHEKDTWNMWRNSDTM